MSPATRSHGTGKRAAAPLALAAAGLLLVAALALGRTPASAAPVPDPLGSVRTWGFAIGNHTLDGDLAKRYAGYDLLVVDAQEATPKQIALLQDQGTIVLGYLSVGTIENYRPWYDELKKYRIAPDGNWDGEYYAQVRKKGYRQAIAGRIAPQLYAKGFDGLFLDNVDMIEIYKRQAAGMQKLVAALGDLVHANGGYLFAQNGFSIIRPMIGDLDGWNREDVTSTYRFARHAYEERTPKQIAATQHELETLHGDGLLVTATDYTARADSAVAGRAVANACEAGALPYVSDIFLRRTPQPPLSCAG